MNTDGLTYFVVSLIDDVRGWLCKTLFQFSIINYQLSTRAFAIMIKNHFWLLVSFQLFPNPLPEAELCQIISSPFCPPAARYLPVGCQAKQENADLPFRV